MADVNRPPASGRAYWVPGLPVVWALTADSWPETGVTLALLDDDGTTVTTVTPTISGGTTATWSLSGVQTATGATRYRVQIDGGYPIQADEIVTLTGWHGRGTGSVNLGSVIVGPSAVCWAEDGSGGVVVTSTYAATLAEDGSGGVVVTI